MKHTTARISKVMALELIEAILSEVRRRETRGARNEGARNEGAGRAAATMRRRETTRA
jgi:hypothetical protein